MHRANLFATILVAALAGTADAQMTVDFSMVGSSVSGITTPVVLNPCPGGRCPGVTGGAPGRSGYGSVGSGGIAAVETRYRPTPVLARQAVEGYISRIQRTNPAAAETAAVQLKRYDYQKIYAGIVAPFGYRTDDLADAMAAYSLLSWLIATGSPDPTPAQARAVRRQVAVRLAGSPNLTAPGTRSSLAEELKLLFVTLHAGWQSARKEGNVVPYSNGVDAMIAKQTGSHLRALRLTNEGFVRS